MQPLPSLQESSFSSMGANTAQLIGGLLRPAALPALVRVHLMSLSAGTSLICLPSALHESQMAVRTGASVILLQKICNIISA